MVRYVISKLGFFFFLDHVPNRTARRGAVQRNRATTAAVRGLAQQRQQQGSQRRESSQEVSAVGAHLAPSSRPAPWRPLSAVAPSIRACHAPAEAGRDQEDPHWSASDRRVSVNNLMRMGWWNVFERVNSKYCEDKYRCAREARRFDRVCVYFCSIQTTTCQISRSQFPDDSAMI